MPEVRERRTRGLGAARFVIVGQKVLLLAAISVLLAACGVPVGAVRVDARDVHRELTGNVLSTGELSRFSENVLVGHDLVKQFQDDPEAALKQLRDDFLAGRGGSDEIFAQAELSFLHGEQSGKRSYFLASALYAWMFLFPEGAAGPDRAVVQRAGGTYELPWGKLEVAFDSQALHWAGRELIDFVAVAELKV